VPTAQGPAAGSAPGASAAGPTAAQGPAAELAAFVAAERKWIACIRQHGFDLPDPDAKGGINYKNITKSQQGRDALGACQPLSVAAPESVARLQFQPPTPEELASDRRYATCMQTHGAPDFPDPKPDYEATFPAWNMTSAGAVQATRACAAIIGHPVDGPGVG
jgi:hypothetical protein